MAMTFRALALAGAILSRARLSGGYGVTFGGRRSMQRALGLPHEISAQDFMDRYLRDGVGNRIVDTWPESCWRGQGWGVYEDSDPATTTFFESEFAKLDARLNLFGTWQHWDRVSGIGRHGALFLIAPGNVSEPLKAATADEIKALRAYSELAMPIDQLETDPSSPRFGLPTFYRCAPSSLYGLSSRGSQRVHHSRVIHLCEGAIDNDAVGQSRLEPVWDLLCALEKVVGSGSEAFFQRCDGTQIALDNDIVLDQAGKQALDDQLENWKHGDKIVRTQGVTITRLNSDVADFKGPVSAIFDLLSASTGIPQSVLSGSERGHLSSLQDRSQFETRTADRRRTFCQRQIIRPTVDRLIELGALPKPQSYQVEWPEVAGELSEIEKVDAACALASMKSGIVLPEEIRDRYLGLPEFSAQQKKTIAAMTARKDNSR